MYNLTDRRTDMNKQTDKVKKQEEIQTERKEDRLTIKLVHLKNEYRQLDDQTDGKNKRTGRLQTDRERKWRNCK